jgi:hypothetical protein
MLWPTKYGLVTVVVSYVLQGVIVNYAISEHVENAVGRKKRRLPVEERTMMANVSTCREFTLAMRRSCCRRKSSMWRPSSE